MKSKEFVSEVQQSDYYYYNFETDYQMFQKYQKKAMDTLKAFHDVCEKESINYQLAFGSLLGAVRDGGQIPWDYDIDVIVPSTERSTLIEALNNYLDPAFDYYSIEHNDDCEHVILRLAPKGYDTHFLHVDVFFVCGLPDNQDRINNVKKRIYELTLLFKAKRYNFTKRKSDSKKEMLIMLFYKIKGAFKDEKCLWNDYLSTVKQYPLENVQKCCLADRFSIDYLEMPTSMFSETMLICTDEGEFRVPKDYDRVLKIFYGEYMMIPPLEKRLEEFKRFYKGLITNCTLID